MVHWWLPDSLSISSSSVKLSSEFGAKLSVERARETVKLLGDNASENGDVIGYIVGKPGGAQGRGPNLERPCRTSSSAQHGRAEEM